MRLLSALLGSSCSMLQLPLASALPFVTPEPAVVDLKLQVPRSLKGVSIFSLTLTFLPSWVHTSTPCLGGPSPRLQEWEGLQDREGTSRGAW